MAEQEITKVEPEQKNAENYWRIPRDGTNLRGVLEAVGYFTKDQKDPVLYSKSDWDGIKHIIGEWKDADSITIMYPIHNPDLYLLKEALDLRRLLDLNGVKYEERPHIQEVISELRTKGSKMEELIQDFVLTNSSTP